MPLLVYIVQYTVTYQCVCYGIFEDLPLWIRPLIEWCSLLGEASVAYNTETGHWIIRFHMRALVSAVWIFDVVDTCTVRCTHARGIIVRSNYIYIVDQFHIRLRAFQLNNPINNLKISRIVFSMPCDLLK